MGFPFRTCPLGMDQLGEAVQILKQLWTQDRASFRGKHYSVEAAICAPKPVQRPLPLWIGGQGEQRLLRWWLNTPMDGTWCWDARSMKCIINYKYWSATLRWWDVTFQPSTNRNSFSPSCSIRSKNFSRSKPTKNASSVPEPLAPCSAPEIGSRRLAVPSFDTIQQYQSLGFDYFIALFPYTHERVQLERFAEQVWPAL